MSKQSPSTLSSSLSIPAVDPVHNWRIQSDVAYAALSEAQKLDLYWPVTGDGPFPVIISVHGGAFKAGDKADSQVLPMLAALERGYAVASINYRMSGEALFPALVQDAKAAVRWLRAHAAELHLDPARFAAWGGSAGGYQVAMLGVTEGVSELDDLSLGNPDQSSAVQAVVDWFGPTDFLKMDEQLNESGLGPDPDDPHSGPLSPESLLLGAQITTVTEKVRAANPETYVHPAIPPFLIQHGRADSTVPYQQSENLARVIRRRVGEDRVELDLLEGAGHGGPAFSSSANIARVLNFLDRRLIDPRVDIPHVTAVTAQKTLELAFRYREADTGGVENAWEWYLWDWNIGVAFFGLLQANAGLEADDILLRMRQWIDERVKKGVWSADEVAAKPDFRAEGGIRTLNVNTCAPMTSVLRLNQLFSRPEYERLMALFDDYIFNQVPRTPCGAITHTTLQSQNLGKMWADTLFMCVLYLAQRGQQSGDTRFLEEVSHQMLLHFERLIDPVTGLLFHGWDDVNQCFIGTRWGRGNAWVTVSTVEILEGMPADFPGRQKFLDALDRQLDGFARLQDASGRWHTVLDHPETYLETSVTAGVAYGVLKGIRLGLVHPRHAPMARRALAALLCYISADGLVLEGSGGTPVKENAAEYNLIPYVITPFTQGLALMALSEAIR